MIKKMSEVEVIRKESQQVLDAYDVSLEDGDKIIEKNNAKLLVLGAKSEQLSVSKTAHYRLVLSKELETCLKKN